MEKITVWDYDNAMHGGRYPPRDFKPVKYEVEAWCVGGTEGITAYFFIGDMFCEANGDDGHWWLKTVCNKQWLKKIKETINMVQEV